MKWRLAVLRGLLASGCEEVDVEMRGLGCGEVRADLPIGRRDLETATGECGCDDDRASGLHWSKEPVSVRGVGLGIGPDPDRVGQRLGDCEGDQFSVGAVLAKGTRSTRWAEGLWLPG